MSNQQKTAGARTFVRSLNLLLKSARLYSLDHERSAAQFQTAWSDLQTLLGTSGSGEGCLLGISGKQLLADGVPVETGPAEKSFVDLLAAAGLASIQFSARTTPEELQRLVRGFLSAGTKGAGLSAQLEQALTGGDGSIRLNAVRYVTEDSALGNSTLAAQLTAKAMGGGPADLRNVLDDPQQLLNLIAAAQGARPGSTAPLLPQSDPVAQASTPGTGFGGSGSSGGTGVLGSGGSPGTGSGVGGSSVVGGAVGGGGFGPGAGSGLLGVPGSGPLTEGDALQLLRTIADLARSGKSAGEGGGEGVGESAAAPFPEQLALLPPSSQQLFQQALTSLAMMAPVVKPDSPMLVQLAEHLAIKFALERFERGEVRVNSIRETLERSSREIAALRKILTGHEQALSKAGVAVESHADVLDRQFWASVPEAGKRAALLSPEAWCIPPRNVRQFVEELLARNDKAGATGILLNYASCAGHAEADARRKVATGLTDMAGLCARVDARVLDSAIRCTGEQITWEEDGELQDLLADAYAKLSQEACAQKNIPSIHTALSWLEHATREKPELGKSLRPRLGVEDRLPDLIEEAIKEKDVPQGLTGLFQRSPMPVSELLAARFNRCSRREECQRLLELFGATGAEGVVHLRELLRTAPAAQAATTVGLLSRFGSQQVERLLLARLSGWNRAQHDVVVRQLALSGAPERGRVLARLFPVLDHKVLAEALDEIGLSGDPSAATLLLRLASGEVAQAADPFMRVKAMESLGRLRDKRAEPLLKDIATAKQMWRWTHPEEMRIVALQALGKMDPEWTRSFAPQSGLNTQDLALVPLDASEETPWARQRRYTRVSLPRSVNVVATTSKGNVPLETSLLSLGGGMSSASGEVVAPGTHGSVQIKSGWRNLNAEVLFREAPQQQSAFEIVEIALEDRARLRRLLSGA